MTDEEWEKMLEGVDEYIDAFKERLRQLKEIQDEAAQKAALEADSDMKATATAASAAALSAATNGFGATSEADAESQTEEGVPTEDGVKHEKNWTKNLKNDDQTVLRTAKEAQEMEEARVLSGLIILLALNIMQMKSAMFAMVMAAL